MIDFEEELAKFRPSEEISKERDEVENEKQILTSLRICPIF